MEISRTLAEMLDKHGIAIGLGVFGGFIRELNSSEFSWKFTVVGIFTSAFVAIVMSLFLDETSFPATFKAGAIGICGYSSKVVLDVVNTGVIKRLKMAVQQKKTGGDA